jgi:hypothetical protein
VTTDSAQPPDLKTAYRIIVTLVDALTASSDLIAAMAGMMGESAVRPLQSEPAWQAYLEAKRRLESVHDDMHRFAEAAIAQIERESSGNADGIGSASDPSSRDSALGDDIP